jgi:hypothetical protein
MHARILLDNRSWDRRRHTQHSLLTDAVQLLAPRDSNLLLITHTKRAFTGLYPGHVSLVKLPVSLECDRKELNTKVSCKSCNASRACMHGGIHYWASHACLHRPCLHICPVHNHVSLVQMRTHHCAHAYRPWPRVIVNPEAPCMAACMGLSGVHTCASSRHLLVVTVNTRDFTYPCVRTSARHTRRQRVVLVVVVVVTLRLET